MKKSLIALAAVAAVGAASAQSTVTISGTFGAGYQSFESAAVTQKDANIPGLSGYDSTKAISTGTAPAAKATNKGLATTDTSVKFTALEDLGGGLKATAAVQFATNELRGSAVTKEDSSIGLAGDFGTVTLANTRTSNAAIGAHVFASWMPKNFYTGSVEKTRIDIDTLGYTSPELIPGLRVGYTFVEAEGLDTSAAKIGVLNGSYVAGPLSASIAFKNYNAAAQKAPATKSRTEGAVTYDLGVAKVGLGYGTKRDSTDKQLVTAGVSAPLGPVTVGYNYASRGKANNFYEAGAIYALSKRTSAQAMIGKIKGGDFAGQQYRVGVLHTF